MAKSVNSTTYESIILTNGEHKEIKTDNLKKYSITRKDVISHKLIKNRGKILVKARKLGFSELIIWTKDSNKIVYRIYVLNRNKHNKILFLAQSLKSLGLGILMDGTILIAKGELSKLKHYELFYKLLKANRDKIHPDIVLHSKLKKEILGDVYYYLLNNYHDDAKCFFHGVEVICRHDKSSPPAKSLTDFLKGKYHIKFIPAHNPSNKYNYKIKIKLIQLEFHNDQNISLGLNSLSGSIGDIFHGGIKGLVEKNRIFLGENDLSLSTLAEPEVLLTLGSQAVIQVGADVPYKEQKNESSGMLHTSWKFAGLKIKLKLAKEGLHYKLDYSTEFTRPAKNGSISGSKEHSITNIGLDSPLKLFQTGFKVYGKNRSGIPLVGSIPILGRLFKGRSDHTTYKKINAIIILSKNEL